MALVDDLRSLKQKTLADLVAAHDYFDDTGYAWQALKEAVQTGKRFTKTNPVTGSVTPEQALVLKASEYQSKRLMRATSQDFLAVFESFFFDLLRLWLLAYPQSLNNKKFEARLLLEAADKDAAVLAVVNRELNEVMYERPADWFAYLEEKAKLGLPSRDEIARFAEAKATRDAFVHAGGVAGRAYLQKAGTLARHKEGELIDLPEPYHREVWELLCKLTADLSDALLAKLV